MLYLGAGRQDLHGLATGLTYIVGDERRVFSAHPDDVDALLKKRFVILHP